MVKTVGFNILLLEDDIHLSNTVVEYLTSNGYCITTAYDGQKAMDLIYEQSFDLLIFDVKVPMIDGFELLKTIRQQGVTTPVIMLTSLDDVDSVTNGFDLGCDDYIRKPFALKELLARSQTILKRGFTHSSSSRIDISDTLSYDIDSLSLYQNNIELKLKNKEKQLLKLFMQNPNILLTKESIFEHIYDYEEEPSEGSLRAYIKTIRSYIGKDKIETIKNIGYKYAKS